MTPGEAAGIIGGFALVILGGLGAILPVLPGPPLSFAGLWLYAWATGYGRVSPEILVVFGVLTALTFVTDALSPALGAKGYRASAWGVAGSLIGAFGGMFVLGPIGIVVGPFIGAFAGEWLHSRNAERSTRVAWGAFVGFVAGSLFRLGVIVAMLAYMVYALFK